MGTASRLIVVLVLLCQLSFGQKAATPLDVKVKEFDAYILKAQKEWEVPGLAVAVVKDGNVILSKGYGIKELGTTDRVDSKTLFQCASTTKAMTAVCMGMLVDEGRVMWSDPVIKHLPEFQLYDPFVTREITIRDLFIHDTGLGNADFLWLLMDIPPDEMLRKMRDVKPTYSLRSGWIYQNIFYVAAGKVIEKVSGKPWNVFVNERLFKPLGMLRTFPTTKEASEENRTKPHDRIEGATTVIKHTNADAVSSAGSVWSSIDDMAKWMSVMIDSSKYSGGRLLSANTWKEIFKPQVVASPTFYTASQLTKPTWTTYGLGWYQQDYKGRKVNYHTGSLAGSVAIHGQLPDERLGIYVFGNLDHAEVRHALLFKCFDIFALGGNRDWSSELKVLYGGISAAAEKVQKDFESNRAINTKPSLPLEAYTGEYSDPLYGSLNVTVEGGQIVAVANNFLKASFDHWHYDTFRGWYDKKWNGKANLTFAIGTDGKVATADFDGFKFKKL